MQPKLIQVAEKHQCEQVMDELMPLVQNQARVAGNVSAGYVNGYLEAANDYDIYTVTIPNGNMLQAQLQQPANSSIDKTCIFLIWMEIW